MKTSTVQYTNLGAQLSNVTYKNELSEYEVKNLIKFREGLMIGDIYV